MKFINKYSNNAAYEADTNRPAVARTVSKIGESLKFEGTNIVIEKQFCETGDAVVYDTTDKRLKVVKMESLQLASLDARYKILGNVWQRTEKRVIVSALVNAGAFPWAAPWKAKITGFDTANGGAFIVTVNATATTSISYQAGESLTSIALKIMAALEAAEFTAAKGWSVTAYAGYIVAQQNFYTPVISTFTITDSSEKVTREILTGNYQTAATGVLPLFGSASWNNGVATYYGGANLSKFIEYYSVNGSDDVAQTPASATVIKQTKFNETDNPLLTAHYGTYEKYMIDRMVRNPYTKNAVTDRDGKYNTVTLAAIMYTDHDGTQKPAYPAAHAAASYGVVTTGETTGFEAGNWWLPSFQEKLDLMKNLTFGLAGVTIANADALSRGINSAGGTPISLATNYWTSTEGSGNTSWSYRYYGRMFNNLKTYSYYVRPLAAFQL